MIYPLMGGVFAASSLIFIVLFALVLRRRIDASYRISQLGIINEDKSGDKDKPPISRRIYNFVLNPVRRILGRVIPVAFYIALPVMFLFYIRTTSQSLTLKLLLALAFISICSLAPGIIRRERIKSRNRKIIRELPYILDLLIVSMEAGLSFDGSLEQVKERDGGELARELGIVLHEIQLGKVRHEALNNMAKRCNAQDIVVFVAAVNQAEQLGMSIGRVLRVQADHLRDKRRQRVREQAMKIPVKMLFPLVFFIFPTIFIVILGPAFIKLSQIFLGR